MKKLLFILLVFISTLGHSQGLKALLMGQGIATQSVTYISYIQKSGTSANPITMSTIIPSTADVLILSLCTVTGLRESGTPTFNGSSFTQVGSYAGTDPIEVWYLLNPSTGTYDISIPNSTTANVQVIASWYSYTGTLSIDSYSLSNGISTTPSATTSTTNNKTSLFVNPVTYRYNSGNEFYLTSYTGNIIHSGIAGAVFSSTKQYYIDVTDGNSHTESWVIEEALNWYSLLVNFKFD